MKTVYADVLFCVNFIIDFALLSVTAMLLKRHIRGLRLTLCAALGAAYSVAVFFPGMSFLTSLGIKLLFSAVITAAAFGWHSAAGYFKSLAVFFAVSFGFGGAVFGICALFEPRGIMIKNDAVYIDIDPFFLFLLIGGAYCAVWLFTRLLPKRGEQHIRLTVTADGRTAVLTALYDSGNTLCDPISGAAVIVAQYEAVARLIPKQARSAFTGSAAACNEAAEWGHGYRLITARGAFGKDAVLPAFRPDTVTVQLKDRQYPLEGLFIAVTDRALSSDGRYDSLIGEGALERRLPPQEKGA